MEQLAEAGASAFSDDGRPVADSRLMAEAMQRAAALGRPVESRTGGPVPFPRAA